MFRDLMLCIIELAGGPRKPDIVLLCPDPIMPHSRSALISRRCLGTKSDTVEIIVIIGETEEVLNGDR